NAPLPAPLPPPGRLSLPRDPAVAEGFYAAIGYALLGERALRIDRAERLAAMARRLARQGPFAPTPELAALALAPVEELPRIIPFLGFRAVVAEDAVTFVARRRPASPAAKGRKKGARPLGEDHPFAKLRGLRLAR